MVADLQARDQPPNFAASQPIATLGQGELVTVTEGPVTLANQRWWKVEVAALVGWIPDLVSGQPALLDSADRPVTPQELDQLARVVEQARKEGR